MDEECCSYSCTLVAPRFVQDTHQMENMTSVVDARGRQMEKHEGGNENMSPSKLNLNLFHCVALNINLGGGSVF